MLFHGGHRKGMCGLLAETAFALVGDFGCHCVFVVVVVWASGRLVLIDVDTRPHYVSTSEFVIEMSSFLDASSHVCHLVVPLFFLGIKTGGANLSLPEI